MQLSHSYVILFSLFLLEIGLVGSGASDAACAELSVPHIVEWEDPEPADAQKRAEDLLHESWNSDKRTTLSQGRTTKLSMNITTLVDRTTGLEGFHTTLTDKEISLEDRLSRLGAAETEMEVIIRLPGAVLFDFDSEEIRPDAGRVLSDVIEVLRSYGDRPVKVEGHTDSVGSEEYNQELSERRAQAVCDRFVASGVVGGSITSAGHGETMPVGDNSTSEGRQQNRRVEIVIEK